MQFLKILFWCLLAFVAAVFTFGNWTTVSVHLFGGLVMEINLPLLLACVFLVGFVPTLLYQHWVRWRLRQRIAVLERALETERSLAASRTAPAPAPAAMVPDPVATVDVPPEPA